MILQGVIPLGFSARLSLARSKILTLSSSSMSFANRFISSFAVAAAAANFLKSISAVGVVNKTKFCQHLHGEKDYQRDGCMTVKGATSLGMHVRSARNYFEGE